MTMETRTCLGCGKADDHPKHQVVTGADHTSVFWHMDCHAAADPDCTVCAGVIKDAEGAKGAELRSHITGERS
jgi:hypothetical protein